MLLRALLARQRVDVDLFRMIFFDGQIMELTAHLDLLSKSRGRETTHVVSAVRIGVENVSHLLLLCPIKRLNAPARDPDGTNHCGRGNYKSHDRHIVAHQAY
jgi:hypothetical protein